MAITESIEIGRSPQEVAAYLDDLARHPEWQENLVDVKVETEGPTRVGTRIRQTRRVGGGTRTFEPIDDGQRTRYVAELDFEGHGLGLLLTPLVRRDAARQLPKNLQRLKERLEKDV